MKIEDHIQFWLDGADHDLDVAESLFSAGKYDWCLFLAQLVIEKALKAAYVRDNSNQLPPRTHNLVRLAETTRLQFDDEQKEFLSEITDYNLEVRYPAYTRVFFKQCTEAFAAKKFDDIAPDEWSDIDLALVSDDFEGDWLKDRNRIRRLTLAVDNRLSPAPYRPESLLAPDPFFKKILETGIAI